MLFQNDAARRVNQKLNSKLNVSICSDDGSLDRDRRTLYRLVDYERIKNDDYEKVVSMLEQKEDKMSLS